MGVFVWLGTSVYSANYELIYKTMIVIFLLYFIPVVFINDTEKYSVTDVVNHTGGKDFPDITFTHGGIEYVIDVKTQRENTKFNMPNITSLERIKKFYTNKKRVFLVLIVRYSVKNDKESEFYKRFGVKLKIIQMDDFDGATSYFKEHKNALRFCTLGQRNTTYGFERHG